VGSRSSSSSKCPRKRVRFAEKLVQSSPVIKSKPSGLPQFVKIGSLEVKLPCSSFEPPQIRGVLRKSLDEASSVQVQRGQATDVHGETQQISVQPSSQNFPIPKGPHSPSSASVNSFLGEINRFRRLGAVRDVLT
jgi:hypothetical protein